jgi:hypothetical protein
LISVSLTPGPYFLSAAAVKETQANAAVKAIDASQYFLMVPSPDVCFSPLRHWFRAG